MDSVAWPSDAEPIVGVVTSISDPETDDAAVGNDLVDDAATVTDSRDGTVVAGPLEDILEADPLPSVLVVRGDDGFSAVARAVTGTDTDVENAGVPPVLALRPATGLDAVVSSRLADALVAIIEGEGRVRERTVLEVDVPEGEPAAAFDVTLVTDEPARISEYGVHTDESRHRRGVDSFRADGVVVATAAGSRGYASALEGPLLSPAIDGVVVAPIGPFSTDTSRWVLSPPVSLSVERDEGSVTVVADGRSVGTVSADDVITVAAGGTLRTVTVPDDIPSMKTDAEDRG
ncbi:NAD(+)/NADH kinase [Halobiforma nitratireducens]|uniref:ATP-NAD/AcoX kinase n=1 Tax=Halobiforma nitratireducens JCM 10879 TaxID=1227454 RepID=M0M204_9EURY|nr:NAD(+)/NADH kinase [Halobiforma nitratireducens]EMA39857.1 ATP-NAD/AcoX kinase [Halobiforma nitratireducens JCM 10879]